jgi:tetratricopeptide (TPR) repeat protein
MRERRFGITGIAILLGSILLSCEQNTGTQPQALPPQQAVQPAQPAPPPPRAQAPSLAIAQLNPNDFSMQAIQANKKRIEEKPDDAKALAELGHANFMIQRYEAARDYYERAVKADPKQLAAQLNLSNCYVFLGDQDKALKQLGEMLNLERDNPEALYNQGLILLHGKKDTAGAKGAWSHLIEMHPTHQLAIQIRDEVARL